MTIKIIAIIPAHLASVRFPRKILYPIHGLPMVEHVRRRALMCEGLAGVYVATCDDEIADTVAAHGGGVIRTSNRHTNGTSRIAEAVQTMDCSHVVLLQGDEPLLDPSHLRNIMNAMKTEGEPVAWNVTGPIENPDELDRHSFVKCIVSASGRIVFCFRRSPCFSEYETQRTFTRKILGIIGYRKDFLQRLVTMSPAVIETAESIEQMRIVESGAFLRSVAVEDSLPSVNEPGDVEHIHSRLSVDARQRQLLAHVARVRTAKHSPGMAGNIEKAAIRSE